MPTEHHSDHNETETLQVILKVMNVIKDEVADIKLNMGKIEASIEHATPMTECQKIQMSVMKETKKSWDDHQIMHIQEKHEETLKWEAHQKIHEKISVSFGKIFAVAFVGASIGTTVCGGIITYIVSLK